MADSLYHRAVGYEHEDIYFSTYEGIVTQTPYIKHYPPDTGAAAFWLKNRQGWRDKHEHEHTGQITINVTTDPVLDEPE